MMPRAAAGWLAGRIGGFEQTFLCTVSAASTSCRPAGSPPAFNVPELHGHETQSRAQRPRIIQQ